MQILKSLLTFILSVSLGSGFNIKDTTNTTKAVPIVIFHGFGATGDYKLAKYLNNKLGVYSEGIEPSPIPDQAANYSIYTPIKIQGASAGEMINNNPFLSGEFDLIGFSQGTIISRYIIQYCNLKGKVRNFVAFGGPLNGQSFPTCTFYDIFCLLKRWHDSSYVFTDEYQSSFAPSNYWKVPNNYDDYIIKSSFLAEANNERSFSSDRKDRFLRLNKALFIKWENEQTIKPAESSWWGEYDTNYGVIHRNETILFQKDLIGIKTLENQRRAKFISIPGVHMEYTFSQIDDIIIPFLLEN